MTNREKQFVDYINCQMAEASRHYIGEPVTPATFERINSAFMSALEPHLGNNIRVVSSPSLSDDPNQINVDVFIQQPLREINITLQ